MKRIKNYLNNFKAPEPIFQLKLSGDRNTVIPSIDFNLDATFENMKDDSMFQLLRPAFHPYWEFNKGLHRHILDQRHTLSYFRRTIKEAIADCSNIVNAKKQVRREIYDWVMRSTHSDEIESTFLELYIYLQSPSAVEFSTKDHAMNVYLILKAMKEKHEGKEKK